MKRVLAVIGVTAGVIGGGAAGFIATSGGGSVSAAGVSAVAPRATTVGSTDTTVAGSADPGADAPDRSARLAEILAPLVADGTITQAQADKVIAALQAAGPMGRGDGDHMGPGMGDHMGPGMGGWFGDIGSGLEAVATSLKMTTAEVMTALQAGTSIADLATKQGVAVQTVIDAAVASVKQHLTDEVAAGDHTQAEADAILAKVTDAVTAMVNGKLPALGDLGGLPGMGGMGGMGGHHGRHHGSDDSDAGTGAGTSDTTTTTLG